jgi:hypothetical protein
MNTAEAAYNVYQLIETDLTERFGRVGYVMVAKNEKDPVYHSRYTIWSNNIDILRLTWDGKEIFFAVEVSVDLPLTVLTKWDTITMIPFNPAYENDDYLIRTAKKVIDSIH